MKKIKKLKELQETHSILKKYKFKSLLELYNFIKYEKKQIAEMSDNPIEIEEYLESMEAWLIDWFGEELSDVKNLDIIDFATFLISASQYE